MTTTSPTWPRLEDVVADIRRVVDSSHRIGCLAHKDADADSLGSSLGFALAIAGTGKTVIPMVPSPTPMLLRHLPGFDLLTDSEPEGLDALFTFDCATVSRFGDRRSLVESVRPLVNVDHHASNNAFGTINLVDPTASASAQVVYKLLRFLDVPMSADVATNLYAGLFTDTGGFRHENTTEETLRLGADLVALGADPGWVALKSYKSRSVAQLRLESLAVSALRTELDGALIWSTVTSGMLAEAAADMQQSEGVIDQLQSIDTMEVAVLFKESAPDRTKVSVRTREPHDATAICIPFGGGGHRRAAGAEVEQCLEETIEVVLALTRDLMTRRS